MSDGASWASRRSRSQLAASACFLLAFGAAAALATLPYEVACYARALDRAPQLCSGLALAALAKTLGALAVGLPAALLLAALGRPRAARLLGVAWTLGVVAYLHLDLAVSDVTGRHLAQYARFLGDADPLRWAGAALDPAALGLRPALRFAGVGLAASAAAWGCRRLGRPRAVLGLLAGVWGIGIAAGPLVQAADADRARLFQADEVMPWTLELPWLGRSAPLNLKTLDAAARRIYQHPPPAGPAAPAAALPARRPHVVLLVLESLRYDAFDPAVMPNLVAFAARGARLDRHYSVSNASHFGFFALLYGRLPLDYFAELAAGRAPTLVERLRSWGYTSHHVTSAALRWKQMERFLGPPYFEVRTFEHGSIWERDRRTLAALRALLASDEPQLVVAYLMSTHFPYYFPPGREPFQPSAPPPNALDPGLRDHAEALRNRYRNAAHSLDAILGDWLPSLDLERTLVVITGDHGESLYDDGSLAHMARLSEVETRVPLVVAGPGVEPGRVVTRPTSHVDVLPTLFGRFAPDARAGLEGRDALAEAGPAYTVLVQSQLRESPERDLVFVDHGDRFWLRLWPDRGSLDFLGRVDADAMPVGEPLRESEGRHFLELFRDFVARDAVSGAQALRKSPSAEGR